MRKTLSSLAVAAAATATLAPGFRRTHQYRAHSPTSAVSSRSTTTDPTNRLPGDPDGSGEAYVFGIDGDPTTLCYLVLVDDIQQVPVGDGMAAHIHEGERFTNGPVVAALAGPEDGNAADCLTEGEMGKFPTGESGIVQRILNNPSQFYINVHNPDYPNGAVRGTLRYQLEEDDDHSHDHDDMDDMDGMSGAPSTPMNLNVSMYSSTAAEIFWDRSSDDGLVTTYRVYRDGQFAMEVPGNSYYIEGLSIGQSYAYTVEAVDNDGNVSDQSDAIVVQTQ